MPRELSMRRGAFTISIDLEILWGVWDRPAKRSDDACAALERTITTRLLDLFRAHDTRVTWAIVARLLDDTRGFDGLRATPACWFAPDIVRAVRDDAITHEIGSHSYGHVYFDTIERGAALADLRRAAEIHRANGFAFDSFVFPRNGVAHLDVVREVGLRVYRSTDAGVLRWTEERARPLRPLVNLADKALALAPPVVRPIVHDDGLVELPSSMLLLARNGLRRVVHPRALARKLRECVRCASREGALFHLWFHPSNFYDDMQRQLDVLADGLAEAATLRARGDLDVMTMGDFASAA